MTYNKNQALKTILLEFLNKKIIKMPAYLEMVNNANNYQLIEDFLIHCIIKFDISYKNYPLNYRNDVMFLKHVCQVRPQAAKELQRSNPAVYNALFANISSSDLKEISKKLSKDDKIKIRKINVINASKQAG